MVDLSLLYGIPDLLARLLERLQKERHRKNRETARYFDDLASTLDAMVEKLSRKEIPTREGHEFGELIHAFGEKTKPLKGKYDSVKISAALEDIAANAAILDKAILIYLPDAENERAAWLGEMERMIGDCRGIAKVFQTGD